MAARTRKTTRTVTRARSGSSARKKAPARKTTRRGTATRKPTTRAPARKKSARRPVRKKATAAARKKAARKTTRRSAPRKATRRPAPRKASPRRAPRRGAATGVFGPIQQAVPQSLEVMRRELSDSVDRLEVALRRSRRDARRRAARLLKDASRQLGRLDAMRVRAWRNLTTPTRRELARLLRRLERAVAV